MNNLELSQALEEYAGCDGWPNVLGKFWGFLDWINYKTLNTKLLGEKE